MDQQVRQPNMGRKTQTNIHLELRYFRRYTKSLDCIAYFRDVSFTAKTIDYSFNGLSVLIASPNNIVPGDVLTIQIRELTI